VPTKNFSQAFLQRWNIQFPSEMKAHRNIVDSRVGLQKIREPEPFLAERKGGIGSVGAESTGSWSFAGGNSGVRF